jgi:hypothetical protein
VSGEFWSRSKNRVLRLGRFVTMAGPARKPWSCPPTRVSARQASPLYYGRNRTGDLLTTNQSRLIQGWGQSRRNAGFQPRRARSLPTIRSSELRRLGPPVPRSPRIAGPRFTMLVSTFARPLGGRLERNALLRPQGAIGSMRSSSTNTPRGRASSPAARALGVGTAATLKNTFPSGVTADFGMTPS